MCKVTLNFVSIAGSMRKIKGRQRESIACLSSLCKTTHTKILTKILLILFTCSVQLIIHICNDKGYSEYAAFRNITLGCYSRPKMFKCRHL